MNGINRFIYDNNFAAGLKKRPDGKWLNEGEAEMHSRTKWNKSMRGLEETVVDSICLGYLNGLDLQQYVDIYTCIR